MAQGHLERFSFIGEPLPQGLLVVSIFLLLFIVMMKLLGYLAGVVAIRSFSAVAFTSIDNRPRRLLLEGPQIVKDVQHSHSTHCRRRGPLLNAHSRRDILIAGGGMMTSPLLFVPKASGLEFAPPSASLPSGLLDSRVQGNVLAPPPYGMEGPDIFYPDWFTGTWKVTSQTKEIQAPCGVALFGGNATYTNALNDIGNVLTYESRFVVDSSGRVIADREYNVKSIAKVALGENSVVDVSTSTPNKFSCLLAPKGAPSMMQVDLIVLNRRQEPVSTNQFDCSEVVREIVSPVDRPKQVSPILKEIETTSLYTYDPEKDVVHCRQRSAAFLLPSNENPMAMKMWQASGGNAIDIRYYDVTYNRS